MNPELVIQDCSKPMGVGSICGVYCLRNTINGKRYIGSTVNMRERWLDHIAELNSGKHCNPYLMAAWRKCGSGSFTFEILEKCDKTHLASTELWWIEHFSDILGWDNLYNLSKDPSAPMRGLKHTQEAREKIRVAMSLPRKGRTKDWKHSEEWFKKRRGIKLTEEHKRKIGAAHLGQKRSLDARRNMSIARRRTVERKRKGVQLCLNLL